MAYVDWKHPIIIAPKIHNFSNAKINITSLQTLNMKINYHFPVRLFR